MGDSPSLSDWVEQFCAQALQPTTAEYVINLIDDGIIANVAGVEADPLLIEELHRSTRAQWRSFVASLTSPASAINLPAAAGDLARTVARRRLELGVLLKIYRVGNRYLWKYFIEVAEGLGEEGPTRDEVLVFLWTRGGTWLDESIEQLIGVFYEERERAMEGTIARRIDVIESILAGRPIPLEAASRTLSHQLDHYQTAFVLWIDDPNPEAIRTMHETARSVAATLRAPSPLTMVGSSRDLWCWVSTPTPPDVAARLAPNRTATLRDVHVALGSPGRGIGGFRTSHEEARAVQRLVISASHPPGILRYDEVDLLCLAGAEQDALERLVRRELGSLLTDSKSASQTRETALAYLTSGSNVEATAHRLFVHRNTVRYRLHRAEELIGHPLSERTAHLELALRYVEAFGVPVTAEETSNARSPRR